MIVAIFGHIGHYDNDARAPGGIMFNRSSLVGLSVTDLLKPKLILVNDLGLLKMQ